MGHVDHGKTLLLDRSARPTWSPARPVASPSTSAPTRSSGRATRSPSSTPRATRRSPPCGPGAPRSPTSSSWWWRPTTASCPRPSRPSTTPRRPTCRSSWPSTRSTGTTPTPTGSSSSSPSTGSSPRPGAATPSSSRSPPCRASGSTTCSSRSCWWPRSRSWRPRPRAGPAASCSRPTSRSGRGPVATVIVEQGTLRVGDPVVAGAAWGKVKALVDDQGEQIKEAAAVDAGPGARLLRAARRPATSSGWPRTWPRPARIGEARAQRYRLAGHAPAAPRPRAGAKLEDLFEQIQRGETATLNLVLKADVQGSLEAVTESLRKLERDDVKLSFVHRGVGGITENDVQLAAASNATIIGFNVRPDRRAREMLAERRRRDPDLRDHLQAARGHRGGHARPARPRSSKRSSPARPRCARSSGCPGSAPSPAATCATASSPGARRSASCARASIIWKGAITSLAPVQGRRPRGAGRLRVRHRPLRLPGPQGGRHHRDLRRAGDPPHLSAGSAVPAARSWVTGGSGGAVSSRRHDNRGRPPTPARCGSTRSCVRSWPRSSSAWPTPTSGCGWSP